VSEDKKNFLQANAELIVLLGLAALCLIIYAQTVRYGFINIDDHDYVYLNKTVLSGFNWSSVKWAFTSFHSSNWHPLTWLSHAIDVSLFGLNPGAHHATNVLFHLINSVLAFIVFRKMTGDFWKSAIVAALFAVHPAHVESVAWISERKDVLSTLFWLLTMLAYFKYTNLNRKDAEDEGKSKKSKVKSESNEQRTTNNRQIYYFLTIVLFALGLMSKPMLVTLPFVLLLCDYWALERLKTLKDLPALIVEKIPFFALALASSVVTILAQKANNSVVNLAYLPLETRLINTVLSYAKYILMIFYPVNLGIWYPFDSTVNFWLFIGAVVLLAGITAFCIWQRKERKYLLMGWLWFLGTLVPVIGLVQVGLQSLADRYTYIPYFGLFIMLVWGLGDVFERFKVNKEVIVSICAIVLIIFAALSYNQASYWQNSETLYKHTLSFTRNNFFLMDNLCRHYIDNAKAEIAEKQCSDMLDAASPSPEAHNTIGLLRVETGKYEEAVKSFQKAIRLKPDAGIFYSNMSVAYAKLGKPDEAEQILQKAFSMKDGSLSREALAYSYNNLGLSWLEKNQTEKAISYFNKALELQPDFNAARENLKKAKGEK
jgi:tetratricopeptide (TPR) repeat protein